MKTILKLSVVLLTLSLSTPAFSDEVEVCRVKVCNKLERFTLNVSSWIQDELGETCQNIFIAKHLAVKGKVLSSESRWYQGSNFNPTKKSVTRVTEVHQCLTIKDPD